MMTLTAKWITTNGRNGLAGLLLLQELNQGDRIDPVDVGLLAGDKSSSTVMARTSCRRNTIVLQDRIASRKLSDNCQIFRGNLWEKHTQRRGSSTPRTCDTPGPLTRKSAGHTVLSGR